MKNQYGALAVCVFVLASCSEPPVPAEQAFIDGVAAALGGKNAIEAASTLRVEGEGRLQNVGQDLTPDATTMAFEISDYRLDVDLVNGNSRTELTRTPQFIYFRGPAPTRQIFGIDGDVAYNIAPDDSVQRASDSIATERRSTYYHHPLSLLRAALSSQASTTNLREEHGLAWADVTTADGQILTIAVDPDTRLPAYIRSNEHHGYLRDIIRTTNFTDYTTVGELTLPSRLAQSIDEFDAFEIDFRTQSVNAAIGDISAPPQAVSAAPVSGPPPADVSAEKLDEGIWFLAGQSHHSVLIEFSDHLMVIEAPNETRTLAVLAKARELVPGKPITKLVNTHHHFDHSAGIRAAISEGVTIVTHAANESFFRRMAVQPSTIVPDALSLNPRDIKIEVFDEKITYEDETMAIELYHIADNPHSSSMLMAYLPKQRFIIQADAFTPGSNSAQLFSPNLLDNIERLELEVDRIVPIHGPVGDFEELVSVVQALRTR